MDLRKLQRVIVDALDDIKAQDIKVFNTIGQTELFDRVVVATATSNRQTRALAGHVRDKVKEAGGTIVSVEGGDTGEWVLVDVGDIVVHIMQPAIRSYYNLEELWGAKPVRVQVGRPASAASRASPSIDEADDEAEGASVSGEIVPRAAAPARRRAGADGPAAGRRPGRSAAAKSAAKPAGKTPAKAAGKTAGTRAKTGTGSADAGAPRRAAPRPGSNAGASTARSSPRKTAARKPRSSG